MFTVCFIYLLQVIFICGVNYYALPKGATIYEFITFKAFENVTMFPGWLCITPFIGTGVTFITFIGLIIFAIIISVNYIHKYIKTKFTYIIK